MKINKNIVLEGKHQKPILVDVFYQANNLPKPIVIFAHGYKGFKDWGAWNLMAKAFADAGFFFIKFNFSHNGGTVKQPIDFPDLEAFGNNNFSKELDDLATVIDWITENKTFKNEVNSSNISLIGHSRGGGIVLIKSAEDKRIKKVITLAGVSDYKSRFPSGEILEFWKQKGVTYITNGRTQQQMPHYFQFYTNFIENENRLTIKRAVKNLDIPYLILHGDEDPTVPLSEAKKLQEWHPKSTLKIIEGANHVFDTKHPWESENIPKDLRNVINFSIDFLKEK